MNAALLADTIWKCFIGACVGYTMALLWHSSRNIFDIKLSASHLRGIGTCLEDIARSLGRIARALETLAANHRAMVQLRRTRGD